MSAPPPAYHQGAAVSLDSDPAGAAPLAPAAVQDATRLLRCPKCSAEFEWTTRRPTQVVCPACGASGRIG